jgi:hypothetical protein
MVSSGLFVFLHLLLVQTADSTVSAVDMTNPTRGSGLIVFLPVVGAVIGAIIGAFANGLYRDWQDKKAQDKERNALLLLVDAEVVGHIRIIEDAVEDQQSAAQHQQTPKHAALDKVLNHYRTPRTEDWDRAKERLAQLLPADHMKAIIIYYKALKDIVDITSQEETAQYRTRLLAGLGLPLVAQARAIREKGRQFLKELPDYDEPDF